MNALRALLRHIGTRSGISIGLLTMVVVVVVVARLVPHVGPDNSFGNAVAPATSTGGQQPRNTTTVAPTPTAPLLQSPVPPRSYAGTSPQTVARSFAVAWLHRSGVSTAAWHRAVATYSTTGLAAQLAQTDPANVPAQRITAALTTVDDAPTRCVVHVPMDSGTLALTMTAANAKWLVDAVDWNRS
jgi:hypothetical protein